MERSRPPGRIALNTALFVCLSALNTSFSGEMSAAVSYQAIALSGEQAPGTPVGTVFGSTFAPDAFSTLLLNEQGQVCFIGHLLDGSGDVSSNNRLGIWSNVGGQLQLVARIGDQASGTPTGAVFSYLTNLRFNDNGQVAFAGGLKKGAGGVDLDNDSGLWVLRNGGLELVARAGDQAPGAPPGALFDSFTSTQPVLNNAGDIVFNTNLRPLQAGVTFDNWEGVWLHDGSQLSLVARQQDPAPGLPAGVVYEEPAFRLGDSGQVLIFSALNSGGIRDRGTWLHEAGVSQLISLESDPVPGEPLTTTYWSLGTSFANAGQLSQTAVVRRDGVLDHSVWLVTSTGLTPLIQDGAAAPGLPDGSVFDLKYASFQQFRMRSVDMVAFESTYSPGSLGSNTGIWVGDPDDMSLVVLGGGQPPGTLDGVIFLSFDNMSLNKTGQVAFSAALALGFGGVNASNNRGIWATDPGGQLRLIVRTGDIFEVVPGDLRVIDGVGGSGINDAGTMAIWLSFTDGTSGIFTAMVPEPGTILLATVGVAAVIAQRRHDPASAGWAV